VYHINPDINNVIVNPKPTTSRQGTYSVIVTGWANPKRFNFDSVPDCAAIGSLYSARYGVELLLESLSQNPVDRVYLITSTPQDKVSGSCQEAFNRLQEFGVSCHIGDKLPDTYLPPSGVCMPHYRATKRTPPENKGKATTPVVFHGRDIYNIHESITHHILTRGTHYPSRGFTGVTNVVAHIEDYGLPEYEPYFESWKPGNPTHSDIDYTYGLLLSTHEDTLRGHKAESTQSVASWDIRGYKHPPCLISLTRFRDQITAVFRSHDIGSAWLLNTKALQWYSYYINPGNKPRQLTIISQMAHIYDWDLRVPGTKPMDPIGHFYFLKNGLQYEVYLNDMLVWQGKSINKLERWIADTYDLSTGHAFWVKSELDKLRL
jgi:hypothetical protein